MSRVNRFSFSEEKKPRDLMLEKWVGCPWKANEKNLLNSIRLQWREDGVAVVKIHAGFLCLFLGFLLQGQ